MRHLAQRLAALAVTALALPTAIAGTESSPEIADARGDAAAPAFGEAVDLVAVWLEERNDTLLVHVAVADLTRVPPGTRYEVAWDERGVARGVVAEKKLGEGMSARYGPPGGGDPDEWGTDAVYSPSTGVIQVQVRRFELYANAGDTLGNFTARAAYPRLAEPPAAFPAFDDRAESDATFVLESYYTHPVPAWGAIGAVLALAGVAAARRRG